ncbi:MAG: Kua-ubiquitin conjugating enzyme hybrid localization domain containing protein [Alphaproteobacteria bacterium]|nr:MAG: Kua-ubiquitin conjugating enzyme hybrid localization domain containing protein [Alphaproteobacteria bacterium]
MAWWLLPLLLPIALFLGDFATGFVHWAVDTWFDEESLGRLVMIAREHHTHPTHVLHYGFLEHATLGSTIVIPVILPLWGAARLALPAAGALAFSFICLVVALCLFFGTTLHNLGHRRSRSVILRFLQRNRLLISPAYHAVHHRPPQTVRYCVVNGWADAVCDRLGLWRHLERLISRLTGAIPRRDDEDWQRNWPERLTHWQARRYGKEPPPFPSRSGQVDYSGGA